MLASEAQIRGIEPHSPLSLVPRVDDRWIVSSIIFVIRNGLRWRDARAEYGPTQDDLQPLHPMEPDLRCGGRRAREARSADDRCNPSEGSSNGGQPAQKGDVPRRIGRTKGELKSKLHAVCDGHGRPLIMLLSEGQMSDYKGAALSIDAFPKAKTLLGDRGYAADWFRAALADRGIAACIPSKANRMASSLKP